MKELKSQSTGNPTTHYSLNAKQIHLLVLIYKFRFITGALLSKYLGLKRYDSVNKQLDLLVQQKFIGKRYRKNYKLMGIGARYYLLADGIKLLQNEHGISEKNLHPQYKNPSLSEGFFDQHIDMTKAYLALAKAYPDTFRIFTKSELFTFDYFPRPVPTLYLNRKEYGAKHDEYLLDIFNDNKFFAMRLRVDALVQYYLDNEWQNTTGNKFPGILFVCQDSSAESKIRDYIKQILDDKGMDDEVYFYTTTYKSLMTVSKKVWSWVYKPELSITL
jgi:hypothetical protein